MEGPPLKSIADKLSFLERQSVREVSGNTKADKERLRGERITRIYTIGKRLVIEAESLAVIIHFLMFGSYRLNERREGMVPRLSLSLNGNELNFYNCSVRIIRRGEVEAFDVRSDVLNPAFAQQRAMETARKDSGLIADLLLDQTVFAGVGNIIKNEALFAAGIHPGSTSKNIPMKKTEDLIEKTIRFSNAFYEIKTAEKPLAQILKVYQKKICESCKSGIKRKKMGKRNRLAFFCPKCQVLF